MLFLITILILPSSLAESEAENIILNVNIPQKYNKVLTGESVVVETEVLLVREGTNQEIVDVFIDYEIKDMQGTTITKLSETKGTILRLQTVKELPLPRTLPSGIYTIKVTAGYGQLLGEFFRTTSQQFEIVKTIPDEELSLEKGFNFLYLSLIVLIVLFLILFVYEFIRFRRMEKLIGGLHRKSLKSKK